MGLLDDAIREHLELKRRRGADPEEVAQAEREALGPPGRPTPPEDSASAHAAEMEPESATAASSAPYDGFDDEFEPDEVPAGDRLEDAPTRFFDRGLEKEPLADDEDYLYADDEPLAEEMDEEYEAPSAEQQETQVSSLDAPTRVAPAPADPGEPVDAPPRGAVRPPEDPAPGEPGEAEPVPRSEAEGEGEASEGEDVLEETPEFLQETPEHDRLWFEQKPPRDFDFGS
jgi:hypothetical protein